MIKEELLAKYSVLTVEQRKEGFPEIDNNEEMMYREFLIATDHIPAKIFENFIENMATASLAETFVVVLQFFKDVKLTYAEVLAARKFAREEINRIQAEQTTE